MMKGLLPSVIAVLSHATSVLARDAGIQLSLSAAAAIVPPDISQAPSLFPVETIQLTDDVLVEVSRELQNSSIASLFMFGANLPSTSNNTTQSGCKPLPGDASWPTSTEWETFEALLGGGLIKASPAAAPCHGPEYSAGTCDVIIQDWITEDFQ